MYQDILKIIGKFINGTAEFTPSNACVTVRWINDPVMSTLFLSDGFF